MSLDEWPLATTIGSERLPHRLVAHLRTSLEVATALAELHRIRIFHVALNQMNILYRVEQDRPVIRIVDFESSYEVARRSSGAVYNPPTTPGAVRQRWCMGRRRTAAPMWFSLGAVLYTLVAVWVDLGHGVVPAHRSRRGYRCRPEGGPAGGRRTGCGQTVSVHPGDVRCSCRVPGIDLAPALVGLRLSPCSQS